MTEAVTALAHDFARLIGTFHVKYSIASIRENNQPLKAGVAGVFRAD
jgi:hypothetical protein